MRPRPSHGSAQPRPHFASGYHGKKEPVAESQASAAQHVFAVNVGEEHHQADSNFDDVNAHIVDLFTYNAVRTVLEQLHEGGSKLYKVLHDFSREHRPQDSYQYCLQLTKAEPELGRRVMVTREALFKGYVAKVANGDADEIMNAANVKVLKDVLMHSWEANATDPVDGSSDSDCEDTEERL
eukprot:CAMPEP_0177759018 /NCGR_PEP_ID=MMETSP0491_2-20121128/4502_1 /TAXON_ID=63592 /ORGANISM="Tetraselmis chuii, Strain PLY429" /LENGTH=181 /DNA_ID=CAMNT_0019274807 /DNA_START=374 /DNA_END=920 /DNA_ORIENTATION=-